MIASIPRFLLPWGHQYPPYRPLSLLKPPRTALNRLPVCRHASTSTPKIIRLERPAKFVPPSHGKRLKQHIPRHYGPQLTQTQKAEHETKQYPHMMPPRGTFMFWFLTNRSVHTFISLVGLFHYNLIAFSHTVTRSIAKYSHQGNPRPSRLVHCVRELEA